MKTTDLPIIDYEAWQEVIREYQLGLPHVLPGDEVMYPDDMQRAAMQRITQLAEFTLGDAAGQYVYAIEITRADGWKAIYKTDGKSK